ncbi:Maf family protein [Brachybacterium sacelli]|uniref:Nucleoside triphosphate pyrophosphatase n=1 Tax=Brachybacterium sacelli TaxID=173364 RepID=A0ABS4X545_9MICO|nr:Maf family protein [Brachybacterium sacelli]MBP2383508.1 septum formation protein [Brachybacterium sacelli]
MTHPTATSPAATADTGAPGEPPDHDPLLLLASASAGRRATLRAARIEHGTLPVDLDEEAILAAARERATASGDLDDALTPAEEVLLLAREKALAATARSDGGYLVLGCDSMLELDGESIGKPHTPARAAQRWRAMRGRSATLHSGHWLVDDRDEADGGTAATFGATASCRVTFADVTDEEIEAYVATGDPLGVAGAFTLDGLAGPFIEGVEGDPHAVVGLSLPLLRRMLGEVGLGVHELWDAALSSATGEDSAATTPPPASA